MQCTTETTLERINMVHPGLIPHFLPVARSLISERGEEEALAATMASLCGYREPPARRSALTYEEGQVTLQMQDLTPGAYPLENTRDAARVLSQHLPRSGTTSATSARSWYCPRTRPVAARAPPSLTCRPRWPTRCPASRRKRTRRGSSSVPPSSSPSSSGRTCATGGAAGAAVATAGAVGADAGADAAGTAA